MLFVLKCCHFSKNKMKYSLKFHNTLTNNNIIYINITKSSYSKLFDSPKKNHHKEQINDIQFITKDKYPHIVLKRKTCNLCC